MLHWLWAHKLYLLSSLWVAGFVVAWSLCVAAGSAERALERMRSMEGQ